MKKNLCIILVMLIAIAGLYSCRGGAAKKAVDIVRKYSGRLIKSTEKNSLMLRHGDDVFRHLSFQKVKCTECGGDGKTRIGTCDACSGDGHVYEIRRK